MISPARFRVCTLKFKFKCVAMLFFTTSYAYAGEDGAWDILRNLQVAEGGIRLHLEMYQADSFKGCAKLTLDIEKYDSFKWSFIAPIIGSVRPERVESIALLRDKLSALKGLPVYISESSPLRRVDDCHYLSDGALLNGKYLFLYFSLYRL